MTDIEYPGRPLTPVVFHILLVLAKGEKHGYEIMKQVASDSRGNVRMGNGTLYGSLKRMLADALIEDAGERLHDDARRKYYRLTSRGRQELLVEMERYVQTVEVIRNSDLPAPLLPAGLRA